MEDWVISEVLGSGSYGTVYLATNPFHPDSPIAVKSSVFSKCSTLQQEKTILEILRGCPEIIRCYGSQEIEAYNQNYYNLLLEYAPGGSLSNLIKNRGKLTELEVKHYTRIILRGVNYIHKEGYVHCDMKPGNILVFPSPSGLNHVKIADFGLAKKAGKHHTYASGRGLDIRFRGTPLYTSPESVHFGLNEPPMDIWSLGCVMVEMFTGKPVWSFTDVHDLLYEIAFGKEEPDIPDGFSDDAKSFLKKCLVRDPNDRWTAKELLSHRFMVDEDSAHYDDQINKPLPSLTKASQVVQHCY